MSKQLKVPSYYISHSALTKRYLASISLFIHNQKILFLSVTKTPKGPKNIRILQKHYSVNFLTFMWTSKLKYKSKEAPEILINSHDLITIVKFSSFYSCTFKSTPNSHIQNMWFDNVKPRTCINLKK
jgi:hypothetical protein